MSHPKGAVFVCLSMEQNKESNVIGVFNDLDALREGFRLRPINPWVERCRVEAWAPNGARIATLSEYEWLPPGQRNGFDGPTNFMTPEGRESVQAHRGMVEGKRHWGFGFGRGTRRQ